MVLEPVSRPFQGFLLLFPAYNFHNKDVRMRRLSACNNSNKMNSTEGKEIISKIQ